jgi:hypothetical protein
MDKEYEMRAQTYDRLANRPGPEGLRMAYAEEALRIRMEGLRREAAAQKNSGGAA